MKPKPIGIVSGAGPLAGAFLLERVIALSMSKHGCHRDSDFPKIILLSYPFTEMLTGNIDTPQLQRELSDCLNQLRQNGASIMAIACNTLHVFLQEDTEDLIHLPKAVAEEIPEGDLPLVLCTSTSAKSGVHKRFFSCSYPDAKTQVEVDAIIDETLKGTEKKIVLERIKKLLANREEKAVVLGCTELSLYTPDLKMPNQLIIDPLEVVANKLVEKSFSKY